MSLHASAPFVVGGPRGTVTARMAHDALLPFLIVFASFAVIETWSAQRLMITVIAFLAFHPLAAAMAAVLAHRTLVFTLGAASRCLQCLSGCRSRVAMR